MSSPATAAAEILVVDDDDSVRRLTERILTRGGYGVTTARSGTEAAELCGASDFDLLLTDIVMPDIDGESLAERLRAGQRRMLVLFMSGYTDGLDLAYQDGATLGKPFTSERLLRAVGEVLDSRHGR